jgi:hypothetical protein
MKNNSPKSKVVKAWAVIFNEGYAHGELTYWSADLHPIFTKRKFAVKWARDLKEGAKFKKRPRVVSCEIKYSL